MAEPEKQNSSSTMEPEPNSPPQPNATHFPHTAKLVQDRRHSTSQTPEVSPARTDSVANSASGSASPQQVSPSPIKERSASRPDDGGSDAEAEDGGEGDAEGDSPGKRQAKATKRHTTTNRSQALAARVQEKMEQAQQRRDQLLDQRAERLRNAEHHRQQKTQLQKEMRQEALRRFVREAPALLNSLTEVGLALPARGAAHLDGNAVQHALVTDPRVCNQCAEGSSDIYQRVCPTSGKPHRRRLVLLAEQLLKLIGETRVNLVVRKDAVGDATLAMSSNKARRGIAINPQIFILAYYNAAVKENGSGNSPARGGLIEAEEDPLLQAAAQQLVEVVAEMDKVLKLNQPGNETARTQTEIAIKPLLITFAKHWVQYAKLAEPAPAPGPKPSCNEAQKTAAANEVLESTIATAVFVHRNWKEVQAKDMDPEEQQNTLASLQAYSQMLFHRALSIAGEDGVNKLKQRLTAVEAETTAATTSASATGDSASTAKTEGGEQKEEKKLTTDCPPRPTLLSATAAAATIDSSEEEGAPAARRPGAASGAKSSHGRTPTTAANPASPVMHIAPVLAHKTDGIAPRHVAPTAGGGGASSSSSAPVGLAGASDSVYTSGSETDVGRWNNNRNRNRNNNDAQKKPMGPELPPRWFVDSAGISRPPKPPTKEELQREQYKTLEHHAKVSYEAKLPLFKESSQGYVDEVAEARKQFQSQLTGAFWEQLKTELNSSPPVVTRVPGLLQQVTSRLVDAVPKRYQQRIGQEMRDVLDWDMLKYRMADPKHLSELMRYVITKVISFGTPAREDGLKKSSLEIAEKLTGSGGKAPKTSLGDSVVEMFQFLLDSINNLLDDISQYHLTVLKPELAALATEAQREFTKKCLPPLLADSTEVSWPSTLKWLCQAVKTHPPPAAAGGGDQQQQQTDTFFVRDTVIHGIVDLLASANTSPETRWSFFPQETMHFDKPHIFTAANIIQLLTLRLMIVGTVQLILSRRKVPVAATSFLKDLDETLVNLLSNKPNKNATSTSTTTTADSINATAAENKPPMTLESLKYELVEEVNMFLADRALNPQDAGSAQPKSRFAVAAGTASAAGGAAAAPTAAEQLSPLSQIESDTIRNAVETMTTTSSLQYTTFEKRVVAALREMVYTGVTTHAIPSDAYNKSTTTLPANFAFANHVPNLQAELFNAARDISFLVQHHLEVYAPSYETLFRNMVESTATQQQ